MLDGDVGKCHRGQGVCVMSTNAEADVNWTIQDNRSGSKSSQLAVGGQVIGCEHVALALDPEAH